MSVVDRLRSVQVTPRAAAYSIIAMIVVLSVAVVTARKITDSSPAHAVAGRPASKSTGVDVKVDEKKAKADKDAKSDDPYAVIVERNLFRPVTAASVATATPKPPTEQAPPKPSLPPMPVPVPMGNIDEVKKNIAFTGAVGLPSGQQALIENLQTKETRFVGQGESAFGYRVMTISSQLVVLEKNGLQFTLTMGENKPDAPAAGGPPKPGGEQKPGGPEGQPRPGG